MGKMKTDEVTKIALEYVAVCKEVKEALNRKEALAKSLLLLIPKEQELNGVKHVVESKGSPSWKKIAETVIKELVPKSKAELVDAIILNSTGSPREYIKYIGE
jgi:hypothetical protein